MANEKFSINEIVFAKMKGYPPWPAKVEYIDVDEKSGKVKYSVFFYGTNQFAPCKETDLFSYLENRYKFGKAKKHKGFALAISQADADISLSDDSSINVTANSYPRLEHVISGPRPVTYLEYLQSELNILQIDSDLRRSLNHDKPCFDTCIKLLDEYSKALITPLMFKKNPNLIDTILKLQVYSKIEKSSDLSLQKLDKVESLNEIKTSLIRIKAEHIYERIKSIFVVPNGKTFLEIFAEELVLFRKSVNSLSEKEILKLSEDPAGVLKVTSARN